MSELLDRLVVAPTTTKTPNRRVVFAIVSMGLFMSSIDTTIVATALPAIHKSLHATINWASWTITIYSLGMVVSLPIAGKISDQFGRRKVFLCGITLFTVSSLLCGLASNIYILILFRATQAIGGGAIQPSAAGIVADHFGRDRDRAIGMFGTVASSGQVVGPLVGGVVVGYFSWRWIFWVNVPIGLLLITALLKVVPESPRLARTKTDFYGLLLLATFVLSINFGITNFGNKHTHVTDPSVIVPLIAALIIVCLYIRHTRRADAPFIPMRLYRARGFAVMNVLNVGWGAFGFGVASLVPLYAQERYHFAALNSGTLLTARGVGAICIGAVAAFALRRTGYRLPMMAGFAAVAIGTLIISVAPRWGISPYVWLSIAAGICGLGNGSANPASRNACLQIAPDEVSAITGLRQMFVFIGVIVSISSVTAILNRSADPGITQAHIMWVVAAVLLFVMIPLTLRVPEHKGSW